MDYRFYQKRCVQLRATLLSKAPSRGYLAYVRIYIELDDKELTFRAVANLWQHGKPSTFEFSETHNSLDAALDALEHAIANFEVWTPELIAATLGLPKAAP